MDCLPLREEFFPRLETESPPAVYCELSACRYMDSTFLGFLVACDGKLRKRGSRLHLVNPSAETLECLGRLGLEKRFLVEEGPFAPPDNLVKVCDGEKPGAEFILRAHEALMETSAEARKKFSLLKETLEKKLGLSGKPEDDH